MSKISRKDAKENPFASAYILTMYLSGAPLKLLFLIKVGIMPLLPFNGLKVDELCLVVDTGFVVKLIEDFIYMTQIIVIEIVHLRKILFFVNHNSSKSSRKNRAFSIVSYSLNKLFTIGSEMLVKVYIYKNGTAIISKT